MAHLVLTNVCNSDFVFVTTLSMVMNNLGYAQSSNVKTGVSECCLRGKLVKPEHN